MLMLLLRLQFFYALLNDDESMGALLNHMSSTKAHVPLDNPLNTGV